MDMRLSRDTLLIVLAEAKNATLMNHDHIDTNPSHASESVFHDPHHCHLTHTAYQTFTEPLHITLYTLISKLTLSKYEV